MRILGSLGFCVSPKEKANQAVLDNVANAPRQT